MKRIPAFPERTDEGYDTDGMTLRDWFAGQALAGYSTNGRSGFTALAQASYMQAEAMLKEREKYGS